MRWSECIIPWEDTLRLLKSDKVHAPTPKTHFAQDIALEKDTPIFCTARSRICIISNGMVNEIESEMMDVQWKTFQFLHEMQKKDVIDVPPCPK